MLTKSNTQKERLQMRYGGGYLGGRKLRVTRRHQPVDYYGAVNSILEIIVLLIALGFALLVYFSLAKS